MTAPTHFVFLNQAHELRDAKWGDVAIERLWRYNLHYFDDLNAQDAAARKPWHEALVARWITQNPPGHGTAWEPYPTSLRIVNWIKWWVGGQTPHPVWLNSLAVQVRWLSGRLEWHLLGNHLFVNAKALVAAGLYFEGAEAQGWLRQGLAILERQIPEQILADGGQFERSPMYHALALEDLLDLINLTQALDAQAVANATARLKLHAVASRMLHWLRCMCHEGGALARFNDCADGIAPPLAELERVAATLGVHAPWPTQGLSHLATSGYIRLQRGPALLLADVAPLGPDYLVGHAHADTLAFELSVGPQRLVVNGGTSCYGLSARRLQERGTAAHSTVELAGQNSSEVWSGFRVGRRARPMQLLVGETEISCAHDGYHHLPGQPEHHRRWQLSSDGLRVQDQVLAGPSAARANFPLAPGLLLEQLQADTFRVHLAGATVATVQVSAGRAQAVDSWHAERFGLVVPNQTLAVELLDGRATTHWRWDNHAHPLSQ